MKLEECEGGSSYIWINVCYVQIFVYHIMLCACQGGSSYVWINMLCTDICISHHAVCMSRRIILCLDKYVMYRYLYITSYCVHVKEDHLMFG